MASPPESRSISAIRCCGLISSVGDFRLQRMLALPVFDLSPTRPRAPRRSCSSSRRRSLRSSSRIFSRTFLTSPTIGTSGVRILADLPPDRYPRGSPWRAARRPPGVRSRDRRSATPSAISRSVSVMRHVGRVAAVHARHADEIRMRAGQAAQAHQRADRRGRRSSPRIARSSSCAPACDDAAARVDHGTLGFPDHLRRAPDLPGVAFGVNAIARQMNRRHRRVVALGLEHVLGNIHQHRPGPSGGRDVKRLVDRSAAARPASSPGNCAWCRSA